MQDENANDASSDTGFDIVKVMELLHHRYPFLLIDKIVACEGGKYVEAIKNVSINEPYFQGHFPGHPVMPGVLILESMAQAGGVMMTATKSQKMLYYLAGVDDARFKSPVVPGDVLTLKVTTIREREKMGKARGEAWVGDRLVAEATFLFAKVTH